MRFEPQSSPGDDDDLPAELAPLASRLSREADALAALYPARPDCQSRGKVVRPARRWPLAAVAAAVVVAAGIGMASRWNVSSEVARDEAGDRDVAVKATAVRPRPAPAQPAARVSLPAVVPAALFHNLSAPQQEAVLDLLDDRRGDEGDDEELTRVSI